MDTAKRHVLEDVLPLIHQFTHEGTCSLKAMSPRPTKEKNTLSREDNCNGCQRLSKVKCEKHACVLDFPRRHTTRGNTNFFSSYKEVAPSTGTGQLFRSQGKK